MSHVVIVGAGLSGLATAFRLRERLPSLSLTLLDAQLRPGGNIWTDHVDGYTVELGPNGIFDAKPHTLDLCRDLGLGSQLIQASEVSRKNRYLFYRDRMHALPGSLWGLIKTPLLSTSAKLRLLSEPLRSRPRSDIGDETVASFARRRFGPEVADTVIDALVTGIHGGDPEQLSLKAAFPRLAQFEQESGSVLRGVLRSMSARKKEALEKGLPKPGPRRMWNFQGGLRVLIETLSSRFPDRIRLGTPVRSIGKRDHKWAVEYSDGQTLAADAVILTCHAPAQAQMLETLDPTLASAITQIPYAPIAVAVLGYRDTHTPLPLEGFGYLAPQHTRRDVLGVQWCSSIYPGRAPAGYVLWRALCGGTNRPEVMDWDDDTLLQKVQQEMVHTMKVTGPPEFHKVVRWPRAIPQYHVGHLERVAEIQRQAAQHPGLFLGGNAYHGIAMNDCCEQGIVVAEQVSRYLQTLPPTE